MHIVIIGATMYGMEQAIVLAQQGHSVLLTTAGSYPGEDLFGTFRAYSDGEALKWVRAFTGEQIFASPAAVKAALLRKLLAAGVRMSFYTRAAAALVHQGQLCAMLLAGPNGLFEQACSAVLDASLLQSATWQAAGGVLSIPKGARLPMRLSLIASATLDSAVLSFANCQPDLFDESRIHIMQQYETPSAMPPSDALSFLMQRRTEFLRNIKHKHQAIVACDTAQPSVLEFAMDAPKPAIHGWLRRNDDLVLPAECTLQPDTIVLNGNHLPYDSARGIEEKHLGQLPKIRHDVLVCGGGTAGVWAAMAAAERGAQTLVIERQSSLGGTRTQGGVVGLYCGNRSELFQEMWERVRTFVSDLTGAERPEPVTEALYFDQAAAQNGIHVRLGAQICHVSTEGRRITGVLSVGDDGVFLDCAKQYIDGTGEGLLCALAGCDFEVGDPLMQMTQNYSQWQRCTLARKAYSHCDQDILLTTEDEEWMRCIRNNLFRTVEYDLYELLTPRETRRIRGRKQVSLRSVARGQRWTDTIYDAYSTFDPHGRSFGTEGRLGALPALGKGRFAAIPLGALLPEQLDGVFITGKAISTSQEGMNFIRMNPDVMSIGWIAGCLAADCIRLQCDADELDLQPLQTLMLQKQAMIAPAADMQTVTAAMLCTRVLAGEDESVFTDVVLAQPDGLDKLLQRAAANRTSSKAALLDMCLMLYHDPSGQERLISQLEALDKKNGTVLYNDRQRDTGVILGGVHDKADDYWQMNRLMILLSEEQCRKAIPAIASVLEHTVPGGEWINRSSIYSSGRLDSNTLPNYDRILCLAHAITAMPDSVFLPELKRLTEEVIRVAPPKAQIWRDYLILRLLYACAACGGAIRELLSSAGLDAQYAIIAQMQTSLLHAQAKQTKFS